MCAGRIGSIADGNRAFGCGFGRTRATGGRLGFDGRITDGNRTCAFGFGINACGYGLRAGCAVVVVVVVGRCTVYMIEMHIAAGRRDIGNLRLQAAGHAVKLAAVDGVGAGGGDFARGDVFELAFGIFRADGDLVAGGVYFAGKAAVSGRADSGRADLFGFGGRACACAQSDGFVFVCRSVRTQCNGIADGELGRIRAFQGVLTDGNVVVAGYIRTGVDLAEEVVVAGCAHAGLGGQSNVGAAVGVFQCGSTEADVVAADFGSCTKVPTCFPTHQNGIVNIARTIAGISTDHNGAGIGIVCCFNRSVTCTFTNGNHFVSFSFGIFTDSDGVIA